VSRIPFLDRLLASGGGSRHFAAVAGPHGIHAVEYRRERGEVVLVAGVRQAAGGTDGEALAAAVADAVEALGGGGGSLSLAVSGYGTVHHILSLPAADDEILRPIVRRELHRYYPDLDDPVIDFVVPVASAGGASPSRELLVGAVPRRLAVELSQRLGERGIVLRHLTVLPHVLQSLYNTFDGSEAATVVVVVLETGALIGCFHLGALRLFIEPPQDVHGRPVRDPAAVAEQVERANLFLRQQFPNVRVDRVLIAAPSGEVEALRGALEEELDSRVSTLTDVPGGSLAALGVALSADLTPPFELLPASVRPRTQAERLTRRLAVAAGALAVLVALWWAGAGLRVARAEAGRAEAVEREVSSLIPEVNRTSEVLKARRAHHLRLVFLEETAASRVEVRRIMAGVAAESRPGIGLESLVIERVDAGWAVTLAGRSEGGSSAMAVRAIDALYRGIQERLPVVQADFGGMGALGDETDAPVAIGFDMSFIVKWQTDLAR